MATKKSAKAVTLESGTLNPSDYQTNAFVHEVDLVPLIKKINAGGGGGGGTSDYSDLLNKPSIESHTLQGNLSASELGLATANGLATTNQQVTSLTGRVTSSEQSIAQNAHDIATLANGLAEKQEKLTAGNNITIQNNTISATIPSSNPTLIGAYSIYDDTERVIGYYFGKPLYQKTITFHNLPNGSFQLIQFYDELVGFESFFKDNASTSWQAMTNYVSTASNFTVTQTDVHIYFSGEWFYLYSGTAITSIDLVLTIRYTKTTDTASTVSYGHENEYDSSIKIVGTYSNGTKTVPVYQQTFGPIFIDETPDETGRRNNIIVGEIPTNQLLLYLFGTNISSTTNRPIPFADAYVGEHQYFKYYHQNGKIRYSDYNVNGNTTIIFTVRWCENIFN